MTAASRPDSTKLQGRPFLIAGGPKSPQPAHRSVLDLWHLLSLDAPTVAAVWTWYFSWSAGVRIASIDVLAMFVAVWMLYATDRLLDAKPLFQQAFTPGLEARHRFHHAHRSHFLTALLLTIMPLVWLLHHTSNAVLHLDVLLACLLGAWLLLVHARGGSPAMPHRLPKEIVVGAFFPAATCIPTVARAPWLQSALLPAALAFGSLCTLNCLFLYVWEHPQQLTLAHPSTRWGALYLKRLALAVAFLTSALSLIASTYPGHRQPHWLLAMPHSDLLFFACALGTTLLLLLHAGRRNLSRTRLRTLADLVLLTPLPVAGLYRLFHG